MGIPVALFAFYVLKWMGVAAIFYAIYVVGIGGGVRVYTLERFIIPRGDATEPLALTRDRWVLEIYRTVIDSLSAIAWMLLVFFIFALIAYVIVKIFGPKGAEEERT